MTMLKNYLKTALRFLQRQRAYAFLNILGLAVGLACSFFILLWVQDELSYDRFHEEGDQLYRVMRHVTLGGQTYTWYSQPMPLAGALEESYPEITNAVLINWNEEAVLARGDQRFREEGRYVDADFFEIFSFNFLVGDSATALDDPNAIVLTESLAEKYFGPNGRQTALGQTLRYENERDVTVTGIIEDVPANSTLEFSYVLPMATFLEENTWLEHWGNSSLNLYVRLREGTDHEAVSAKIRDEIEKNHEGANAAVFLQPLRDVRLRSDFEDGRLVGGRIEYVRIFGIVAVFIVLIACINFMNLATARASKRAKEIGVRKVVGASQGSLVLQFLGESVLMALIAFVVALALVAAGLPAFNTLADKAVTLGALGAKTLSLFLGMALAAGVVAGSYPALYLASMGVMNVLRSNRQHRSGGAIVRKGLVIFQFALSILFIIGTFTVYRQLDFIRHKNLGLDRANVVYTTLEGPMQEQYETFRQALLARPGIAEVTRANQNPLSVGNSTTDPTWDGKAEDNNMLFHVIRADIGFTDVMKMEIVEGRTFSADFGADSINFLVNEQTAAAMRQDGVEPVGARLSFWNTEGAVVGVVKDFHFNSLYEEIEPVIIRYEPNQAWRLFVRTKPGQAEQALASMEAAQAELFPEYPFAYRFLDADFEEEYRSEQVIGTLANYFAMLAIFIACLGLFGLAAFTAEQRTKEIGVRKVLGASVSNLVLLLSRDFVVLVVIAFVVAAPVAYFVMQEWLASFAYRTETGLVVFALAGLAAIAVAFLTVGYQATKAAIADPVKSLRYE